MCPLWGRDNGEMTVSIKMLHLGAKTFGQSRLQNNIRVMSTIQIFALSCTSWKGRFELTKKPA